MNRRDFMKSIGAIFAASLAFSSRKAKAIVPAITTSAADKLQKWEYATVYANRQFRAKGKRIKWSEIGIKENMWICYEFKDHSSNWIDLPTFDFCVDLFNSEDCLIWLGSREIYRLRHTHDDFQFIVEFLGYRKNSLNRMGYQPINISRPRGTIKWRRFDN